jgi:UDP-N-acetylmuramyl pentapeptide phosphotransferase/UDP-N-acetylglucosamine-1-phosphate transferase
MHYLFITLAFLLAVCLSRIVIPRIIIAAVKKNLYDEPEERKLHTTAVPRLGGFAFVPIIFFSLAFVIALLYKYDPPLQRISQAVFPEMLLLSCGLLFLYLIGIWDDLIGARYRMKFAVQILAASLIPLSGLWINNLYGLFGIYCLTPWVGIPFTILLVVFIVNAINLIDGIDGLASGLSSIALGVMGVFFILNGSLFFAMLSFVTVGVLLPFFYYNVFGKTFQNKKIFMGDTGSLTLGYILAFLAIRLASIDPLVLPVTANGLMIAFSTLLVPMLDVCRVMLVRIRNKKHLFTADNNHIHHQFLKMGFTPRGALIRILLISCLFCAANIALVNLLNVTILFLIDMSVWVGLHLWFKYKLGKVSQTATELAIRAQSLEDKKSVIRKGVVNY